MRWRGAGFDPSNYPTRILWQSMSEQVPYILVYWNLTNWRRWIMQVTSSSWRSSVKEAPPSRSLGFLADSVLSRE
jgi:hypothetical protein